MTNPKDLLGPLGGTQVPGSGRFQRQNYKLALKDESRDSDWASHVLFGGSGPDLRSWGPVMPWRHDLQGFPTGT